MISKILQVTFVDVDDTPPMFVNSGCTSTCYACPVTAINANTHYGDQVIWQIICVSIPSCGSIQVDRGFAYFTIEAT